MFWDKLFKRQEKSTEVTSNYSVNNFDYDKLSGDEKKYVSKLMNEYISFFNNNEDISKLDIDMINEIKMYQDLALNIMHKEHLGNIFMSIIDSKKLFFYSHKIDELNNELKYRYYALNRLRKDKKYLTKYMGLYVLGKNKINVIRVLDNQINIINNLLVVTNKNIYDYNSFVLANMPSLNKVNIQAEIKELFEQVKEDYQSLYNVDSYIDDKLSIVDKIVYLELFIDKFIYENKDLIDKLKEKLDIISNSEIKDKEEQKDIIDNLMKIKKYYIIYNRYGRNKISKEEFEELYQIIFNVYTYYPYDCELFKDYYFLDITLNDEKDYYKEVIYKKIEDIKNRKSNIFSGHRSYGNNLSNVALKYIPNNISYLLTNQKNLSLLLSFDYENGLDDFFNWFGSINSTIPDFNYNLDNSIEKFKYLLAIKKYINKYNETDKKYYDSVLKVIDEYVKYSHEIELYEEAYKKEIDFNILPRGITIFDDSWFEPYLKICSKNPIVLPNSVSTCFINLSNNEDRIYILPDQLDKLTLNLKNISKYDDINNKIVLSDKLGDNFIIRFNVNFDTDLSLYINYLSRNLGNVFIFKEDVLEKSYDELILYFSKVFEFYYDILSSDEFQKEYFINRARKQAVFKLFALMFENISIIDHDGNIRKIDFKIYEDSFQIQLNKKYTNIRFAYKRSIESLVKSLLEIKINDKFKKYNI